MRRCSPGAFGIRPRAGSSPVGLVVGRCARSRSARPAPAVILASRQNPMSPPNVKRLAGGGRGQLAAHGPQLMEASSAAATYTGALMMLRASTRRDEGRDAKGPSATAARWAWHADYAFDWDRWSGKLGRDQVNPGARRPRSTRPRAPEGGLVRSLGTTRLPAQMKRRDFLRLAAALASAPSAQSPSLHGGRRTSSPGRG